MATKSILSIPIDDAAFNRFYQKFNEYQAAVAKQPANWKGVGVQISGVTKDTRALVAALAAQTSILSKLGAEEKKAATWASATERAWLGISRSTKGAAAHIRDATTSLLKWGSLTGVFSGLLGAGGLFGIDRLASATAAGRRASFGVGASFGERRSFGVNFGRLVDPGSFLSSVAEARSDITRRVGFYGAGLTEAQLRGSTAEISVDLLRNLKRLADNTDPRMYGQVIAARQLGQFASAEDLRRLHATSPEEFEKLVAGYRRDATTLDLSSRTQRMWQDFDTQMSRAGQQIETTFVKGLLPLVPGLDKLSASFEKVIRTFLGSDTLKKWLAEVDVGLEKFADYIGTPEFEQNVRDFVSGLGDLASAIGNIVKWIGAKTPAGAKTGGILGEREGHDTWNEIIRGSRQDRAKVQGFFSNPAGTQDPRATEAMIRKSAVAHGLDPDIAVAVAKSEGLYRYTGDQGTSFGPFQLHYKSNIPGFRSSGLGDAFTKATGLDARNPQTTQQQIDFALDWAKKHGWQDWHGWRGSPYAGGAGSGTVVRVDNNTGGNAIVTSTQLQGQN